MKTSITVYSHGILVKPGNEMHKQMLVGFCHPLLEYTYRKQPPTWAVQRIPTKVYAGVAKNRTTFVFHKNQYDDLIRYMISSGANMGFIDIEREDTFFAYKEVEFNYQGTHVARDYQIPLIDYLANENQSIKVLNLQTGKGKTASSLWAMEKMGVATIIQTKGGYLNNWLKYLLEDFKLTKDELYLIRGGKQLKSLIAMAKEGDLKKAKVFLISTGGYRMLIDAYEQYGDDNPYGITPFELCNLLKVGLKIVDETHEHFHANFKSDIYTHVPSIIHLSATLDTDDNLRKRLYEILLPSHCWYRAVKYDSYIQVLAYHYNQDLTKKIKTKASGSNDYSHAEYEKDLMTKPKLLNNYFKMISYIMDETHFGVEDFQVGQKVLIYCSLVSFCFRLKEYLDTLYGNLDISVYVSDTEDYVLESADVIISTIGSMGTSKDVADLRTIVMTRALGKKEANIQALGRLRRLKNWPSVTPIFSYMVNDSIEAHIKYHYQKKDIFKGKILSLKDKYLPISL